MNGAPPLSTLPIRIRQLATVWRPILTDDRIVVVVGFVDDTQAADAASGRGFVASVVASVRQSHLVHTSMCRSARSFEREFCRPCEAVSGRGKSEIELWRSNVRFLYTVLVADEEGT